MGRIGKIIDLLQISQCPSEFSTHSNLSFSNSFCIFKRIFLILRFIANQDKLYILLRFETDTSFIYRNIIISRSSSGRASTMLRSVRLSISSASKFVLSGSSSGNVSGSILRYSSIHKFRAMVYRYCNSCPFYGIPDVPGIEGRSPGLNLLLFHSLEYENSSTEIFFCMFF